MNLTVMMLRKKCYKPYKIEIMKTKLLTIIMLICFTVQGFAQNNDMKARMEFEDAETAYQNQNYSKAVTHLENAEKLLGKPTGKTRYLLILAKANVFLNTEGYEYKDLEKLRDLSKYYLDNYTTDTEKYREIYDLSNVLNNNFPKTEQEYNQLVFKKIQEKQAQQIAELDEQLKEVEKLKQAQDYIKSLAQKYGGFVSDITVDEFAKLSPVHQEIVDDYKKNKKKGYGYRKDKKLIGPKSAMVSETSDIITRYSYVLKFSKKYNNEEADAAYYEIIKTIQDNIDPKYYKEFSSSEPQFLIKVPGLDLITIGLSYISYYSDGSEGYTIDFYSRKYDNYPIDTLKKYLDTF